MAGTRRRSRGRTVAPRMTGKGDSSDKDQPVTAVQEIRQLLEERLATLWVWTNERTKGLATDEMIVLLRKVMFGVGVVFALFVAVKIAVGAGSWLLSKGENDNDVDFNATECVQPAAEVNMSDAFVRAIVADETAKMMSVLSQFESTVDEIEIENRELSEVLELDRQDGFDLVAHTALSKINIMYAKLKEDMSKQSGGSRKPKKPNTEPSSSSKGQQRDALGAITSLEREMDKLKARISALGAASTSTKKQAAAAMAARKAAGDDRQKLPFECLDKDGAREVIHDMLSTYSADVIGLPDYALAAVGSKIERRKGLTSQDFRPVALSANPLYWLFSVTQPAESAIDSDMTAGNCWACTIGDDGSGCSLTIRLVAPTAVTAVSIDHISSKIALDMRSAPKRFKVFGLRALPTNKNKPLSQQVLLGEFVYNADDNLSQVQTFSVGNSNMELFPWVRFQVLENHGHPDWTCIYRVRVH